MHKATDYTLKTWEAVKIAKTVDQTVDTQQPTPQISPFYAVFRVSICPADFDSGHSIIENFSANPVTIGIALSFCL